MSIEDKFENFWLLITNGPYDLITVKPYLKDAFLNSISETQSVKKEKTKEKVSGYDVFINCQMGEAREVWRSLEKEEKKLWKEVAKIQNNKT
jgi:hypothetical protein